MSSPQVTGAPPRPVTTGRILALDGWRGIAILVIVFHNAGFVVYDLPGRGNAAVLATSLVLTSGWVGVQLFFVLSGYLITGILLETVGSRRYFSSFYARRTFRIFPVYYVFLAFAFLVAPVLLPGATWYGGAQSDQLWYWLYLSNWKPLLAHGAGGLGHLWSLAVEEQFYLVWPLLVVATGRHFRTVVLLTIAAAPLARAWMIGSGLDPEYAYYFTHARADALAIGAFLALAARDDDGWAKLVRRTPAVIAATSVGLLAVAAASRGFGQYQIPVLIFGQSLIAVWFAGLMALSLSPTRRLDAVLQRGLERPWIRAFGKYSYVMYVVHVPLAVALAPRFVERVGEVSPWARILATLGYGIFILLISLLVAMISWTVMERPLLRLKERIAPRPVPTGSAPLTSASARRSTRGPTPGE